MSSADLAVSRAGASTLWELCANGLPTLFIPFPHAASDHQYHNARFIVDNNLGWCERESEDIKTKFTSILEEELESKSRALLEYASRDVAKKMIHDVIEVIND
jgi:UDP-N-acetylglucosamine--N-acetylmuramyl-(pentapeptide) pyrophosphoryl-undecaprenol N-acetylglucosamine transferase